MNLIHDQYPPILNENSAYVLAFEITELLNYGFYALGIHPDTAVGLIENYFLFVHHAKQVNKRNIVHSEQTLTRVRARDFFEEAFEMGEADIEVEENYRLMDELYQRNPDITGLIPAATSNDFFRFIDAAQALLIDEHTLGQLIADPDDRFVFVDVSDTRKHPLTATIKVFICTGLRSWLQERG